MAVDSRNPKSAETQIISTSYSDLEGLRSKLEIDLDFSNGAKQFPSFFQEYAHGLFQSLMGCCQKSISVLISELRAARSRNARIFILGNGGSAANASHFATDLAKDRFGIDEYLFRVMSLVDNTALISATANDYGYEEIFTRQLKSHLAEGDVVIAISSSGNSANVVEAVKYANQRGAYTFGIVGFGGGELGRCARTVLNIPSKVGQYGFMEDVTSIFIHTISIYIAEQDQAEIEFQGSSSELIQESLPASEG